jgi:hypothetical protein
MSQNARNKASKSNLEPLTFQSEVGLFLVYLLVRTAPLVAVVFYFSNWLWAILAALLLIIVLIGAARYHNHRFLCQPSTLSITPSFWYWAKPATYTYTSIQQATLKIASRQDKRQWLALQDQTGTWRRFRCDWLHQQDPPSVDEHDDDTPQHELFELLDEEDFYHGSIQHLGYFLQQQGISIQIIFA